MSAQRVVEIREDERGQWVVFASEAGELVINTRQLMSGRTVEEKKAFVAWAGGDGGPHE